MINADAYDNHWERELRELQEREGIHLNRRSLPGLARCGLGPRKYLAWPALESWVQYVFPPTDWGCPQLLATTYGNPSRNPLRWLVAGTKPVWIVAQLRAVGCDVTLIESETVVPIERPLLGAAESAAVDCALIFGHSLSVEAVVCATDWLHERSIPYGLVTEAMRLPQSIESGGVALPSIGPGNWREAVRKIAARFPYGMDMGQPDVPHPGDDPVFPPTRLGWLEALGVTCHPSKS